MDLNVGLLRPQRPLDSELLGSQFLSIKVCKSKVSVFIDKGLQEQSVSSLFCCMDLSVGHR